MISMENVMLERRLQDKEKELAEREKMVAAREYEAEQERLLQDKEKELAEREKKVATREKEAAKQERKIKKSVAKAEKHTQELVRANARLENKIKKQERRIVNDGYSLLNVNYYDSQKIYIGARSDARSIYAYVSDVFKIRCETVEQNTFDDPVKILDSFRHVYERHGYHFMTSYNWIDSWEKAFRCEIEKDKEFARLQSYAKKLICSNYGTIGFDLADSLNNGFNMWLVAGDLIQNSIKTDACGDYGEINSVEDWLVTKQKADLLLHNIIDRINDGDLKNTFSKYGLNCRMEYGYAKRCNKIMPSTEKDGIVRIADEDERKIGIYKNNTRLYKDDLIKALWKQKNQYKIITNIGLSASFTRTRWQIEFVTNSMPPSPFAANVIPSTEHTRLFTLTKT